MREHPLCEVEENRLEKIDTTEPGTVAGLSNLQKLSAGPLLHNDGYGEIPALSGAAGLTCYSSTLHNTTHCGFR
jgi:hypothetical protein